MICYVRINLGDLCINPLTLALQFRKEVDKMKKETEKNSQIEADELNDDDLASVAGGDEVIEIGGKKFTLPDNFHETMRSLKPGVRRLLDRRILPGK